MELTHVLLLSGSVLVVGQCLYTRIIQAWLLMIVQEVKSAAMDYLNLLWRSCRRQKGPIPLFSWTGCNIPIPTICTHSYSFYPLETSSLVCIPFVVMMSRSDRYLAYYNEARILDAVTFNTITTLPNLPAAVNNFLGGRTYPLAGAAVLLPQYAPYTDPVTVTICGGSTPGAGIALDNCVSISPEAPNATWTLERMPSKRVMACMVALPDGTFLIVNGARQGYAGFGLASDPNLGALLYDPALPVGRRMSVLNDTIVARLYHSEATLLPDGRVLVRCVEPRCPRMLIFDFFDEVDPIQRRTIPMEQRSTRKSSASRSTSRRTSTRDSSNPNSRSRTRTGRTARVISSPSRSTRARRRA